LRTGEINMTTALAFKANQTGAPVIHDVFQGHPEWHALRCGMITGSIVANLITPTGKIASNATSRACLADLLAQRITNYVDPGFEDFDMQRGLEDEPIARALYVARYAPVEEVGFVTREVVPGIVIGCSPDGLVGEDGGIEIKSRKPKIQIDTILSGAVPSENVMQIQTFMLVTQRPWCDYVSYSGGLPLAVIRCAADHALHEQIIAAVVAAENSLAEMRAGYENALTINKWRATERVSREIEV
jgi:hypothetical protein